MGKVFSIASWAKVSRVNLLIASFLPSYFLLIVNTEHLFYVYTFTISLTCMVSDDYDYFCAAYTNQFVKISVSLSTMVAFTCTYLNQQIFGEKSCSVVYKRHQNCKHLSNYTQVKEITVAANTLDTLTIDLLPIPSSCNESETNTFCYTATAVNNNITIEIEGNFSKGI